MKKLFLAAAFFLLCVAQVAAQAKKPKLMVIPSDTWCIQNGYVTEYEDMSGNMQKVPDYNKAFQENEQVSMIIGAMENFMNNEGYDVVNLSQTLKNLTKDSARDNVTTAGGGLRQSPIDALNKTAKPDIIVDLFYSVKKDGPYKYLEFNIGAFDAYCSKPVSTGNLGRGTSASSTQIVNQLDEAVLSFKDKFINDMDQYYNRLFDNGRQIVIRCTVAENSPIDFESEIGDEELSYIIEDWVSNNTYKGNYTLSDVTENELLFDNVRIPMISEDTNGNVKGTDARSFGHQLARYISQVTGTKVKEDLIGSGKINLILGGKE